MVSTWLTNSLQAPPEILQVVVGLRAPLYTVHYLYWWSSPGSLSSALADFVFYFDSLSSSAAGNRQICWSCYFLALSWIDGRCFRGSEDACLQRHLHVFGCLPYLNTISARVLTGDHLLLPFLSTCGWSFHTCGCLFSTVVSCSLLWLVVKKANFFF